MEKITSYLIRSTVQESGVVKAWEETVLLPTYEIGEEEKNPMFLEKRVYQGSSGVVYPYPVVEKISDTKVDKPYKALFIENQYIKVMILPELGGRVQMAYDKVKQRHFVYYNQVIKPALVGLTGPWISGGIEFNWPQHHRPSTYLPTEYRIEEHADGSKTVWCNEVERMFRTKGMQGFRIYPDKAYLEINVKIYNRTAFPQTFLWWANPAVVVNDAYKSVFPPDVHAVFDHGKRDVSNFPIATGVYYKQDYSEGVDISKYKNIPVPTSYMAIASKYNFVGGYEDDTQAGLLHVANHHVSPGKKQWTWGNGDFGVAWDRNLTDEDGPYIELMTGVYTDNQPDFSWLRPYEEKTWTQYFMPYAEVGYVTNASKDVVMHIDYTDQMAHIIVYTTSEFEQLNIVLRSQSGKELLCQTVHTSPSKTFKAQVPVGECLPEHLILEVRDAKGKVLLSYQADKDVIKPTPEPAVASQKPEEIASIEQLFLTGMHLEQYRHATYNPLDYYHEALRREPKDARCNNAIGLLLMRRGQFTQAESYFRTAIATLTQRNPNPYDGEAYYNLGWSLKMQNRLDVAYDAFFKSTWNAAFKDAGHFSLAQIDCIREDWTEALGHIDNCLISNWHNHKARQLKASILRKLLRTDEALQWVSDSLKIDQFNIGCWVEKGILENKNINQIDQILHGNAHTYIEYALDYASAGMYPEAIELLTVITRPSTTVYPMVYYALGYFYTMQGNTIKAHENYDLASKQSADKCFPNRIEEVNILQDVMRNQTTDAKAPYYLGNFWYAARQYNDAIACWEASAKIDPAFPSVLRNLALANYNKRDKPQQALLLLEDAFRLNVTDARILMELDQLYKKQGKAHQERLAFLEQYADLVEQRDDLSIERITLYNQIGNYTKAKELIASRQFHPWEGGEGKVTGQYIFCRVQLAKQAIAEKHFDEALQLLSETDVYPHNLGEGKLINAEENEIDYYKGLALQGMGQNECANTAFLRATVGAQEPAQAFFYNDQQPDKIYYQGLAWRALGEEGKARIRFNKLIAHGEKHLFDEVEIDYFAVSLPDLAIWNDNLSTRNQIHCYYVMALGYAGLGNQTKAQEYYDQVKKLDVNHQTTM